MTDEKPKDPPSAPPRAAPPKLERVPAGYAPASSVRPPAAAAAPPPRQAPGASYGLAARDVGADAAIAAGLAHEGDLATESALRLFGLAAAMQATGRLEISPDGKGYALSFRRGTVEHAASTDPEDDLGRFLVRRGALSVARSPSCASPAAIAASAPTSRAARPYDAPGAWRGGGVAPAAGGRTDAPGA